MSAEDNATPDLLGAYALNAVEDDEQVVLERFLAGNPVARAELTRLRSAVDAFVSAEMDDYLRGDPPAPPADLWQRIAAQLPLSPVSAPADDLGDELADGRRRRVARQRRIAGAIAAAAVVAGLSFVAGRTVAPSNPPVEVAASLQARADQARGMPGSRSGDLVAKDGRVLERVVVEPGGQGYIQTVGLAAPDADHAYQLWILDSGQPISLGLLGRGVNTVAFGTTATTNTLAITVEPVSGSAAATTPPIAVAELR